MAYLIDTNVISELRKADRCDPQVAAWQNSISGEELFASAISMMEIRRGVLNAKRTNAEFAKLLEEWYEGQVKLAFLGRVLSVDLAIAERCSELMNNRSRGMADALIASTAYEHDLILATRNIADFSDTGIEVVNPWDFASH